MSLSLSPSLQISQKILLTPQMQQALRLLQMPHHELMSFLQEELMENPFLEALPSSQSHGQEGPEGFLSSLANPPSLEEHLMPQIQELHLTSEEKSILLYLVKNLTPQGYLDESLDLLAERCAIKKENLYDLLKILQNFDPLGLGAQSLQDCLKIQAKASQRPHLVDMLDHMEWIIGKKWLEIGRHLDLSQEEIFVEMKILRTFNPYPALSFQQDIASFVIPDIYAHEDEKGFYTVSLNETHIPRLGLSSFEKENFSKDEKAFSYVQEKTKAALWLIKSLKQRQQTLLKVGQAIVEKQKSFLKEGPKSLKPMLLKDIARDLSLHESTISRAISQKFIHTSRGVFELKTFFARDFGEDNTGIAIKESIKKLIHHENREHPLSDQKIVERLKEEGVQIARRTVTKYREIMQILPSHQRKKESF